MMKIEYEFFNEEERWWEVTEVTAQETELVTIIINDDGSLYSNYSYYYNDGTSMPNSTIEEQFTEYIPSSEASEALDFWNEKEWTNIKVTEP